MVVASNSNPASHLEQSFFLEFGAPEIPKSAHDLHSIDPNSNDTFAPGHTWQDDEIDDPWSGLNLPGAQSLHVVFESAPIAVENLPTVQFTQVDTDIAPILLLNFPASHELQLEEAL